MHAVLHNDPQKLARLAKLLLPIIRASCGGLILTLYGAARSCIRHPSFHLGFIDLLRFHSFLLLYTLNQCDLLTKWPGNSSIYATIPGSNIVLQYGERTNTRRGQPSASPANTQTEPSTSFAFEAVAWSCPTRCFSFPFPGRLVLLEHSQTIQGHVGSQTIRLARHFCKASPRIRPLLRKRVSLRAVGVAYGLLEWND